MTISSPFEALRGQSGGQKYKPRRHEVSTMNGYSDERTQEY